MPKLDNQRLFEEFIDVFPESNHTQGKPFVIGFIAVVGSGKSTVATRISELTGAQITSNDQIRRFLNDQGFHGDSLIQDTVQYIAEHTTDRLLARGISHIIDADLLKFHELARRKIEGVGAKLYLIELRCPEETIRSRIIKRAEKSSGYSRAGIEEYELRKAVHEQTLKPQSEFVIHTDEPLEPQLDVVLRKLREDGVVGSA